jgi:hypothetical protein
MASLHTYTFDNLSRIGDDVCALSERDTQNNNFGTYLTKNYFEQHCGMEKPIDFATKQPNVFFKGGHGGAGGCNVDSDSNLRIGTIQTNPKCRISLSERPFKTVPFLGRGRPQPDKESRLQQGSYVGDKKSCKKNTEKSYSVEKVDLVPSLQRTIQNPSNLIEGEANKGWIRGGIP